MEQGKRGEERRRVGILGGNFNPIHSGHLQIARRAYEQFSLREVWFLPASVQPLKRGMPAAEGEHRRRMVELAIADTPYFVLCDYELEHPGISYTCETLEALSHMHPDTDFYFILGADSLDTFHAWKDPERICACAVLLAAVRRSGQEDAGNAPKLFRMRTEELRRTYGARIEYIDAPFYDVSSTQIRDALHRGETPKELPAPVARYIQKYRLYETE